MLTIGRPSRLLCIARREEILVRRVAGQCFKEIAHHLHLSLKNVEYHWSIICRELQAEGFIREWDIAQVCAWAWEWHLVGYDYEMSPRQPATALVQRRD